MKPYKSFSEAPLTKPFLPVWLVWVLCITIIFAPIGASFSYLKGFGGFGFFIIFIWLQISGFLCAHFLLGKWNHYFYNRIIEVNGILNYKVYDRFDGYVISFNEYNELHNEQYCAFFFGFTNFDNANGFIEENFSISYKDEKHKVYALCDEFFHKIDSLKEIDIENKIKQKIHQKHIVKQLSGFD